MPYTVSNIGYECGAWSNNNTNICYPVGFGDGPGTYQTNRRCTSRVSTYEDTEQIKADECNSTIGEY